LRDISHEQIQNILDTINSALKNHNDWYENLMRTLVCRIHMDDCFIAKDAHRKCKFGHWFYDKTNSDFHNLPAASKIGKLHKTMHDSARNICLNMRTGGLVQTRDYDRFSRDLNNFREALEDFRHRILITLESVTSK